MMYHGSYQLMYTAKVFLITKKVQDDLVNCCTKYLIFNKIEHIKKSWFMLFMLVPFLSNENKVKNETIFNNL